jgi:two-component system NtrC family response regulator
MTNPRVLLVDDDESLLRVTEHNLARAGFQVTSVHDGQEALETFLRQGFDVVVTDLNMPRLGGLDLIVQIKRHAPDLPVIVLTAYGTVDVAVEAMRRGARDFIPKPFEREELAKSIRQAIEHHALIVENRRLREQVAAQLPLENLVAESAAMRRALDTLGRVAQTDTTVLLQGESGSGKEVLARALHHASLRSDGPFIAINCPAIPEQLLESEMFGHVRGAFTGAIAEKMGKFEQANGGTLFLDEIGDMRLDLQAKLLRVLQEREIDKVGARAPIPVDVRIIVATNRDLGAEIEAGRFREDLFYRISVVPVLVPPLRERREDIEPLSEHFIKKHGAAFRVSQKALDALRAYNWPGNVRELENVILRAAALSRGKDILDPEDLPEQILDRRRRRVGPWTLEIPDEGIQLEDVEKELLRAAMEKAGGNQSQAARLLGITRQTLLYRLEKYEIAKGTAPEE